MSLRDRVQDTQADQWVVNMVVLGALAPILMVLVGVGIGVLGLGIRTALTGDVSALPSSGALASDPVIYGILAGLGGFYWIILNLLAGPETISESVDNAEEVSDAADEFSD